MVGRALSMGLGFGRRVGAATPAFSPANLFLVGGSRGAAYDFTDWTKVFTDTARTTAVTANGQAIAGITDLSGLGNHIAQLDSTKRALSGDLGSFKCAVFDGVNDGYQTPAIDFSTSDEVTVIVGHRKTNTSASTLAELGNLGPFSQSGTFQMLAHSGTEHGRLAGGGTIAGGASSAPTAGYAPPRTSVYTGILKVANDTKVLRIDGVEAATSAADQGAGNFINAVVNIGARNDGAANALNGSITRWIVINRILSPSELVAAELWVNAATGASFP